MLTFAPSPSLSLDNVLGNCGFSRSSYVLKHSCSRLLQSPSKTRRQMVRAEVSLADAVKHALKREFKNNKIDRILDSFSDAVSGRTLENNEGTPMHQRATSFIDGLEATPFIDDFTGEYQWVQHLEKNWTYIRDELLDVTARDDLAEKGNNVWAPPVVEAANTYGPDWRTLVLQDRVWDPINTKLFPVTTGILRDDEAEVPSIEAFFARQAPETGIKLHTDECNFILTMHLGLTVPQDKSWIEVGGQRRYWEDGKVLVFNTSFYHQTMNESTDQDRIVLLLRFWHPQLSAIERKALQYLFSLIDDPDNNLNVIRAKNELDQNRRLGRTRRQSTSARGFGK